MPFKKEYCAEIVARSRPWREGISLYCLQKPWELWSELFGNSHSLITEDSSCCSTFVLLITSLPDWLHSGKNLTSYMILESKSFFKRMGQNYTCVKLLENVSLLGKCAPSFSAVY